MIFHLNYIQESSNIAIKTAVKDMLIIALGCMSQIPTHIKGELHTHCRTQCITMTQPRWPLTPCHMRHYQNFDKVNSFLKPLLNILILRCLFVGWGGEVIRKEAAILHQIYKFRGDANNWREQGSSKQEWILFTTLSNI